MKKIVTSKYLVIYGLLIMWPTLILACNAMSPTPSPALTSLPSALPRPSSTATALIVPTRKPGKTSTPSITETPSLKLKEIVDWPSDVAEVWWENSESIVINLWGRDRFSSANVQDAIVVPYEPGPTSTTFEFVGAESITPSNQQTYVLACTDQDLRLYRSSDLYFISQTSLRLGDGDCNYTWQIVAWAPDETAVAFIADDGNVYIWEITGAAPLKVGPTDADNLWLSWSPNSQELLVVNTIPGSADSLTYSIAYRDGRPALLTDALLSTRTEMGPVWINDSTIKEYSQCGASCSVYTFYDADTGKYLVGYTSDTGGLLSPNNRWLVAKPFEVQAVDQLLYDFQKHTSYALDDDRSHAFEYLHWSDDSTTVYMINRLTYGCCTSDCCYPPPESKSLGELVAFDPAARKFIPLLADVIYSNFTEDQDDFFAISRPPQAGQNPQLLAALYDRQGRPMTRLWPLGASLNIEEAWNDDVETFFSSWSPHSNFVIFTDWQGTLWLLDRQNNLLNRATRLSVRPELNYPVVVWSPDETYAVIISERQAWFMSTTNIQAP